MIKVHDTIRLDITTSKIIDNIKFEPGNVCMVTGGRNTGRVGTIMNRERHPGSFDIVHVKVHLQLPSRTWILFLQVKLFEFQDANGHTFATRLAYIFVIGKGSKPYISLPKGGGIKLTVAEERDKRLQQKS